MVTFDTNVVVRLLVGDEPSQTKKAERSLLFHTNAEGVFIPMVTLAEVSWVLTAAYDWDRTTVHSRLLQLIRTRGIVIEDLEQVLGALDDYQAGKADFADYLILGRARARGGPLLTFDRKLGKEAGVELL